MDWDMTAWLVPTIFWIFVGAVILVPVYLRSLDRQRFYDTVRAAYERGQPVSADLIEVMKWSAPLPPAERDMRTGLILIAAGLGMGGLGYGLWYGLGGVDDISAYASGGWVGGVGAILALVGIVHLGFWLARRGHPQGRPAEPVGPPLGR